jgi:hypothetical protein
VGVGESGTTALMMLAGRGSIAAVRRQGLVFGYAPTTTLILRWLACLRECWQASKCARRRTYPSVIQSRRPYHCASSLRQTLAPASQATATNYRAIHRACISFGVTGDATVPCHTSHASIPVAEPTRYGTPSVECRVQGLALC